MACAISFCGSMHIVHFLTIANLVKFCKNQKNIGGFFECGGAVLAVGTIDHLRGSGMGAGAYHQAALRLWLACMVLAHNPPSPTPCFP